MNDYIISASDKGTSFPPLEAGSYNAICYAIVGIGTQYNKHFDNYAKQVVIVWEIPSETIVIEEKEMPRAISKTYTESLHEKSNLRKNLESWRGRAFSPEEQRSFSLGNILGAPCLLGVVANEKDGKTYTSVGSVSKIMKGTTLPEAFNEKIIFNICDSHADLNEMDKLPKWIQERIKQSEEYRERMSTAAVAGPTDDYATIVNDDDLPF